MDMIWNHPAICRDCLGRARIGIIAWLLAITGSIGLSAGAAESSDRARMPVMPKSGISAHRGASTSHPENTLPAFREAIRLGAHQIELDVYLTKDKHLVIMHDSTVDRTTDGTGKIADLTLAEIKQLDAGGWKGPQYAGERVPTLEEVLAIMPDNVWLNLHLKGDAELGAAVARQVVRDQRTHQAFLAAGRSVVEAARKVCPEILVCNMDRRESYSQYVSETIAQGADFIQLFGKLASPDDMAKLKAARVRINYCCTNDPESLKKLRAAGVDFALVDNLGKMMDKAAELGIHPLKPVFRTCGAKQ
jgi:glycerophosphoryl diester phosphodiesterase